MVPCSVLDQERDKVLNRCLPPGWLEWFIVQFFVSWERENVEGE